MDPVQVFSSTSPRRSRHVYPRPVAVDARAVRVRPRLAVHARAGRRRVLCDQPRPAVPIAPAAPAAGLLAPEFSRLVLGKSEAEVIEAVGRPDETSEDDDARYWHFKKRTLDPLTQEKDTDVQVVIKGGKVANINY